MRKQLKLKHAKRVLLLGNNDFQAFEAATRVLESAPNLKFRVVIHCQNLRFMRTLLKTSLGRHCIIFNRYNMAGMAFVRRDLRQQFARSEGLDNVVVAGFGRFGQSVVEQLRRTQERELAHVVIIDQDAERRMMVVEEQQQLPSNYERWSYAATFLTQKYGDEWPRRSIWKKKIRFSSLVQAADETICAQHCG